MSDNLFGPLVTDYDVGQAILDVLQRGLPGNGGYLAETTRRMRARHPDAGFSTSTIPAPKTLFITKDFTDWPEQRLPAIQAVPFDMAQEPEQREVGYTVWYRLRVLCVVSGDDEPSTSRRLAVYKHAIPWLLMQHQTLDKRVGGLEWTDSQSGDVENVTDQRTLQAAVSEFTVRVDNALEPWAGPALPDAPSGEDPGDLPLVESADADITRP